MTALDSELEAVTATDCGWQPLRLAHDDTRYKVGSLTSGTANYSLIAAAAPRMGMAASAVLVSKIIHQFRPRFVAMTGICAGRIEDANIGDIIIADPTWDWGSGKIETVQDEAHFRPTAHQLPADPDVVSVLKERATPQEMLAIKLAATGKKPPFELTIHTRPLVSGAAVVAHKQTFDKLRDQHGKIVGLDMEAYGVAAAALGSGKPRPRVIIAKAVCDHGDEHKHNEYQPYAASVSAQFILRSAASFLKD